MCFQLSQFFVIVYKIKWRLYKSEDVNVKIYDRGALKSFHERNRTRTQHAIQIMKVSLERDEILHVMPVAWE